MSDFDALEEKIKKAQHLDEASIKQQKMEEENTESRRGMQAGVELVANIFIPAFIGYWIDDYFGTSPAFLLILFFLGVCAGFFSVYRLSQNLGSSVGYSELHKREKDAKTSPIKVNEPESGSDETQKIENEE